LARHFELAELPEKAALYRLQAGAKARRMSANEEASSHLRKGLQLIAALAPSPMLVELELGLQTALGTTLVATHGYASSEVENAFCRARELTRALDDPRKSIPVLYGLSVFDLVSGKLEQALEEASQLLALTHQADESGYQLGAHLVLGVTQLYLGRLDEAHLQLEQSIVDVEPRIHLELAYAQGQDPVVASLSFLSLALWLQGYPERAQTTSSAALALASKLNHPHTTAYASSIATTLYQILRLDEECARQAAATVEVSKGRFPLWQAAGSMTQGWAQAMGGGAEAGITAIEQGLALWEGTGALATTPYFRARLAEAHLLAGNRSEGLRAVDEALRYPEQAWWLPEEYRLRAELLLLAPGCEEEAATSLHQGLESARSQQARSLELRLCMSLARLLHTQGCSAEGRELLASCYGSFSEGFQTPDLSDARALLAELEQKAGEPNTEVFATAG
jgi:tetratricopeptide (TPR) repeat protein